jgi:hypothetical protein
MINEKELEELRKQIGSFFIEKNTAAIEEIADEIEREMINVTTTI